MKTILFLIVIPFLTFADEQDDNLMKQCQDVVKEKCVGMNRQDCAKKGLIPKKCEETENFLLNIGKQALNADCSVVAQLCKYDYSNLDPKKDMMKVTNFYQKCIAENQDKIPPNCKKFMDFMQNPLIKEINEATVKGKLEENQNGKKL